MISANRPPKATFATPADIPMWSPLLENISLGNYRSLARAISLVENEHEGWLQFLQQLPAGHAHIVGITGPPGAGKSTLVDGLIGTWVTENKKVGVLCVDPSSPFNLGAVLGDRVRMNEWYNHPNVYIRSLASRGSLGGLNQMIIEITAVMQAAGFDYILIETIGIGQSEVEIAGLADTTVVVLVPEAGDEIQTMKAGVMEIADIFVVNKSDRPDADRFVNNLKLMMAPAFSRKQKQVPIIKTVAEKREGMEELKRAIVDNHLAGENNADRKLWLLTQRALQIIQRLRMKDVDPRKLKGEIENEMGSGNFNLFRVAARY